MLHGQCKGCARTTWLNNNWYCNKCNKILEDYKQNVKNYIKELINRYNVQCDNYEEKMNDENYSFYKGVQFGFTMVGIDLQDLLKNKL